MTRPIRIDPPEPLLTVLMALTVVSGIVDAVSYLGLGHVFTANMTGNIVVIGFAVAGAAGFSVPACACSIGAFLVGAVVAGRLARHTSSRRSLLLAAMSAETVCTGAMAIVASQVVTVSSGWPRFTLIAVLAFSMGIRNAAIRRLAVSDVTTTVLTMTLTGLAADSSLAGGDNPRVGRRTASVVAMFVGALVGAALLLHVDAAWPLGLAAAVALVAAAVTSRLDGAAFEPAPSPSS